MFSQLLTIARNTFVESVRQPIYFILIALCGLCQVFTTWSAGFTMGMTETSEVSGDNKFLLDVGLATVFVCGLLLAAFLATAVISREIENKTVLTVVSKPVSRVTVVLGKYLGVAGAIFVASLTMSLFLFIALRHEVMSTAADDLDGPVILFVSVAVGISLIAAIWCNFFYGWVFPQTATMLLCPLMFAAWIGVLLVNKKWHLQSPLNDFKPQIFTATICVIAAHLVLTSLATAASARLGQVMTLVVCCGVFVLGFLSNHFLGNRAIDNQFVARIREAEPQLVGMRSFDKNGDIYRIQLEYDPRIPLNPGMPIYFGPNPNGSALSVRPFEPYNGSVTALSELTDRTRPPAVVLTGGDPAERLLIAQRVGAEDRLVLSPPTSGDYLFLGPTKYNVPMLVLWSIVPNVQYFWLLDAVNQSQIIPDSHLGLVMLYGLMQVGVFLSLAVVLFQRREVG